jgi:hypothetical protein
MFRGLGLLLIFALALGVSPVHGDNHPSQKAAAATTYQRSPQKEPASETIWQRTARDPVALYTLVLAVFTVVLSLGTLALWYVTWRTLVHAREDSKRQGKDAKAQLDLTTEVMRLTQRAFVFGSDLQVAQNLDPATGVVTDIILRMKIMNFGMTPATDLRTWITFQGHPMNQDRAITFTPADYTASVGVLGPHSDGYSTHLFIPIRYWAENWRRETELLVWFRVEYRDIFEPEKLHHHESTCRVELYRDPTIVPPKPEPMAIGFESWGPQNTTG